MNTTFDTENIAEYMLTQIHNRISGRLDKGSLMLHSMNSRVVDELSMNMYTAIIDWMNLSYKHEPIIVEKTIEFSYPNGWFQMLKQEYKFLQKVFGSVKLKTNTVKYKFLFEPESIFVDAPYVEEFKTCRCIIRRIQKPVVMTIG